MKTGILKSLLIIGTVSTLAIGGTYAAFSDVEQSADNTMTAGILNLNINSEDPWDTTPLYTLDNIAPGDPAQTRAIVVKNDGSVAGKTLKFWLTVVEDSENNDPESETNIVPPGDLDDNTSVKIAEIVNSGSGDVEVVLYTGSLSDLPTTEADAIMLGDDTTVDLPNGAERRFNMTTAVSSTVGNDIQGDKFVFKANFKLEQ